MCENARGEHGLQLRSTPKDQFATTTAVLGLDHQDDDPANNEDDTFDQEPYEKTGFGD